MKILNIDKHKRHLPLFILLFLAVLSIHLQAQSGSTTQEQKQIIEELYKDATLPNGDIKCATAPLERLHFGANYGRYKDLFEQRIADQVQLLNQSERQAVVYEIPIIFHIIHNGEAVGTGNNIAASLIEAQLDQLNNDFRKIAGTSGDGGGVDTQIQFCLALLDENAELLPETGINRVDARTIPNAGGGPYTQSDYNEVIKPATQWNPDQYLNIWVGSLDALLGFAQFPEAPSLQGIPFTGPPETDGCVVRASTVGSTVVRGSGPLASNGGRTLTHEIGHWLGLRHVSGDPSFLDDGCLIDDFCADTPAADANAIACPTGFISCTQPEPVENYMNFTDDDCMERFTQCQTDRMRVVMGETGMGSPRREILLNSTVCQPVGDFDLVTLQPTYSICKPDNIIIDLKIEFAGNFSGQVNLSINNLPAGLNANFSNNPITQSGVYTITLTGTNSVALGDYNIDIVGSEVGGSFTSQTTALLSIQEVLNNAPNLLNPANGAINQARKPVLTWSTLAGSSSYDIEIAMDANFNNIVDSESSLFMTSFETTLLAPSTIHYWRVRGKNDCGGVAPWSNTFSFTTSAAASSTGTCSQPLDGICGMTYIGDLEDGEDNIDNYDPSGDPNSTFYRGPEQIYEVILTELSNVTFLLTDFDADLDLQLLTNCNDPINDWVTASNRIGVTEFERIDIRLSAGTYYIIVDGWQGAISEYILSIECEPVCESNGIVEDFESGQPSGWTFNVSGSGPNSTKRWMFDDGGFGIMSQIDNPGIGNWAYYDDFGNGDNGRNNVATARTPTVDLTGQSNIRIGFDYAFVETPIVDGETVRLSITDGPNTRYWNGVAWTNTVSNWLDDFTPFTNNGFLDIAIPNGLNISNLSVTFRYDDGRDRNNSGEGFGFDNFSLCGEIPNVCEDDLMVTGNPIEIDAGTYSANNTITSTGTVAAGTNVEFVAGQSITLEENFHAVANSTFTARIGACTSTARKEVMEERTEKFSNTTVLEDAISVYPNPMSFQNTIAIELSDAKEVSIELRNLTGQYVQSILPATTIEAGKHQFEWNARNLNSGIYFLVVRLDDKIRTQKLSLIK